MKNYYKLGLIKNNKYNFKLRSYKQKNKLYVNNKNTFIKRLWYW